MYKGKHEKPQYDPDMPCKNCDAQTRASCCGCPEQLEYERKKKLKMRYDMDDILISYDAVVDIINGEYCACCDETEEVLGNILEELKRLKESSGSK